MGDGIHMSDPDFDVIVSVANRLPGVSLAIMERAAAEVGDELAARVRSAAPRSSIPRGPGKLGKLGTQGWRRGAHAADHLVSNKPVVDAGAGEVRLVVGPRFRARYPTFYLAFAEDGASGKGRRRQRARPFVALVRTQAEPMLLERVAALMEEVLDQ